MTTSPAYVEVACVDCGDVLEMPLPVDEEPRCDDCDRRWYLDRERWHKEATDG